LGLCLVVGKLAGEGDEVAGLSHMSISTDLQIVRKSGGCEHTKSASAACNSCCSAAERIDASVQPLAFDLQQPNLR
jgi:hypothetical protein